MENLKVDAPLNISAWLSLSTPETVAGLPSSIEELHASCSTPLKSLPLSSLVSSCLHHAQEQSMVHRSVQHFHMYQPGFVSPQ